MISQKTVQLILETARIEDVVGDFVTLKRRGANMMGLCPFHNEKTPSFVVSPAKNICKCFGCGKGGDPVRFMMELENYTFPEALKWLAKRYNIEVEEIVLTQEAIAERQEADSLHIVNERALKFFQDQLFETDKGKSIGLSYFKQRQFREETIRRFGLGFAPDHGDSLTKTLISEKYSIDLLRKLGLTTQNDRDFFRNRVMFAIHNLSGKPIAFAGRIMNSVVSSQHSVASSKEHQITEQRPLNTAPKYINSPETEVYFKSKTLYGLYQARKAIQKADECILVEGYTDVISLHQAGIENVVASSGTSLTVEQIRLIKRFTPNIKIIYDGDAAGIKAALRGLDLVLEEDLNVKIVLLPDKDDPDSYVQKVGAEKFINHIAEKARDFIFFKTEILLSDAGNDPVKKSKLIKEIVSSIAKIPDPVKRQLYIRECAALMRVDESVLVGETGKLVRKSLEEKKQRGNAAPATNLSEEITLPGENTNDQNPASNVHSPTHNVQNLSVSSDFLERDIARILVTMGHEIYDATNQTTVAQFIINNIEDVLNTFDNSVYQSIVLEAHKNIQNGLPVNGDFFLNHTHKNIRDFTSGMLTSPYEYSHNWEEKFQRPLETQLMPDKNFKLDSEQSVKRFKLSKFNAMCDSNKETIKKIEQAGDIPLLMKHLKIQQRLEFLRNQLAKELNKVVN